MLLPLGTYEPKHDLRLVDGVLQDVSLDRVAGGMRKNSYDRPQGERQNLVEAKEAVEEGDCRRLSRWLLESHTRVTGDPILVVTLDRHFEIKARPKDEDM